MKIEIVQWDEHNSKSDQVRSPHWFKVSQRIGTSTALFELTSSEKWVWILILAERCRQKTTVIEIKQNWFCSTFNVNVDDLRLTVKKLSESGVIVVTDSEVTVTCHQPVIEVTGDRQTSVSRREERRGEEKRGEESCRPLAVRAPDKTLNGEIWSAYRDAYFSRYQTEPVRNAKVNSQVAQLAKRLGQESVEVVRFYLGHNKTYYVQKMHDLGLCVADAEGLRTQWATGTKVTNVQAQQIERGSALQDQLKRIREGKL